MLCNDGFGNLTTVNVTKGTAPSLSVTYNAATNRRTTDSADANGNILQSGVTNYDVENRITAANITNGTARYSYAPGNKRIWRGTWVSGSQTVDEITYYSAGGAKLCSYNLGLGNQNQNLVATSTGYYEYFGGQMIRNAGGYVNRDRLGSIGKFFPYGQERPSATANGKEKFATYTRDAETGLDYAQNRYHSAGDGRFLSPDPYRASAGPSDPGSWNRYAYTRGDPVNRSDPGGLEDQCNYDACVYDTYESPSWSPQCSNGFIAAECWGNFDPSYSVLLPDKLGNAQQSAPQTNKGTTIEIAKSTFKDLAKTLAKMQFKPNCEKDFKALGLNGDKVRAAAANAVFLNAVGQSTPMSELYAYSPVSSVRRPGTV